MGSRRALLVGGLLLAGTLARAHGGPVEASSLRIRAGAGDVVLGTSFGLVHRQGGSAGWEVICSEAIGYNELYVPIIHAAEDGALFVGSLAGLFVSRDGGCSWDAIDAFTSRGATAVVAAPGDAATLFVTTGKWSAENGLFRSTDNGVTFPERLLDDPETFYSAVRFAPSEPGRAWVSAWYFAPAKSVLYRSDDGGLSFTALDVSDRVAAYSGFTLLAIHPADPDELLLTGYDDASMDHLLLRTTDGGATFTEVGRDARAFRSALFSADGATAWAAADRLHRSDDGGATFQKLASPLRAGCVGTVDGEVHVCGAKLSAPWALARVVAQGGEEPAVAWSELRERVCPAGTDVHATCRPLWSSLALALGVTDAPADGGTGGDGGQPPDAGDGGGGGGGPGGGGCHCTSGGGLLLWAVPALLAAALRRRRSRPRRSGRSGLLAAAALLLAGCPAPLPDPPPPPPGPCETFVCDGLGRTRCVVVDALPRCACDEDLEERNDLCLPPVPPDPCDPNPCTAANQTACTAQGGAAICGCDAGYELDGPICVPVVTIACDNSHDDGDDFEPDECPELARDVGTSGQQAEPHTFAPAGDQDWYRVLAQAEQVFSFRAVGDAGLTLRAEVFASDALSPVGGLRTATGALDFAVKSDAAQVLYFRARAGALQTGPYVVSVGDEGLDDFPDAPAAAPLREVGEVHPGVLQYEGDVDALAFELGTLRSYRVQATGSGGTGPLRLELHAGLPLAFIRAEEDSSPDFLTHAAESGARILALSAPGGERGTAWTVRVLDLGPDDHGNDAREATALATGLTATGALERPGDRDAFRFEATAGHVYRFRCTPPAGLDCHVTLLGPSGAIVAGDTDGGEGEIWRKLAAGGSYVAIVFAPGGQTFTYSYALDDLGPDDHGDDPGTATSMGMPVGSASGAVAIQFPGDRDFLHLDADPGHIYRLRCTRGTLGDCNLRLFNAAGLVAQDADGGDALLMLELGGGGDHYLELSGGPGQVGTATWRVEDLDHDDHGNTLTAATPMLANSAWVQGELQTPVDRDWFRFEAIAGRSYRLTCQPQALPHCELRLYDLAENLLASQTTGPGAIVTWTAPATGFYAFRIDDPGGQLGTYLVKVEDLGP